MTFENYLSKENLIDNDSLKMLKTSENSFLEVSKNLCEEIYFNSALEFYNLIELKNTYDLSVDFENSNKVDEFSYLIEKDLFCFKNNKNKNIWLIKDPDDFKTFDKIRQNTINPIFAISKNVEFKAIQNRLIKPAEVYFRAEQISKTTENKMVNTEYNSQAKALYKSLLDAAIDNRASDMHIIPMSDKVKIAFRIDGNIENFCFIPLNILNNLKNVISNEGKLPSNKVAVPQEGKISYEYKDKIVNIRINIIPTLDTYDINLRFLSTDIKTVDEIGFLDDEKEKLLNSFEQTKGLVIITGPTGSGKTTTLYAALNEIRETGRKIMSLEDPVEINLDGVTQINIRKDYAFDFEQAVATTLRHDPNIALIGECKTTEVAKEIIKLSDTGHLALTTLHTNDSVGAISRLINLGIMPYAIGDVLTVVVAQRLVRRICPHCKQTYELEKDHKWRKIFNLGDGIVTLAKGTGCSHCEGRGYKERLAIVEFLIIDKDIRESIQLGENRSKILRKAKNSGFENMLENGIKKALLHLTTFDELEPYAKDLL